MRKNIAVAVSVAAIAGVLSLSGCGAKDGGAKGASGTQGQGTQASSSESNGKDIFSLASNANAIAPDDLAAIADEDVEKTVASLNEQYEALIAECGSFDAYQANVDKVQAYYDTVLAETNALGIRLREYAANCASYVLASDRTSGQMYDDLEVIYDDLYDSAGDDLYDAVYDDLFGNLYDAFYDGVVKDGYDSMGYGEWSEISSAAYDMYSDAMSDAYDLISDCRSDIYDFGSDVRGDVFGDKLDKAKKELSKFQEDIEKLKEE